MRSMAGYLNDLFFSEKLNGKPGWDAVLANILAQNGDLFVSSLFKARC
jgi:hypothetical protein